MPDETAPEADAPAADPADRGGWRAVARPPGALATAGLAAGLILVLLVVLVIAVVRQDDTGRDDRVAALAAARQVAVDYTTYDYRHIRDDFERLKAESTGPKMAKDVGDAINDGIPLIKQGKVVSKGHVVTAGVADAAGDKVAVIAAVDATVTNVATPTGAPRRYRFQIVMTKVDGRWLVSDLVPQA